MTTLGEYLRGLRLCQTNVQSSVDKAVNALAQPEQEQGRSEAFKEIAEKVKEMPWENDTKDSFIVWLQGQA